MSKLLITGANGFIGSHLVETALQRGYKVHAGVRASSNRKWLKDTAVDFVEMDFEDTTTLSTLFQQHKYDYIVHCVGVTKTSDTKVFHNVNCEYVKTLVDQLRINNAVPKKLIFLSSLAAYGSTDFQETDFVNNDSTPYPVTKYGKSKLAAERYLESTDDIPFMILRPTVVYGPRETELFMVFELLNKRLELYSGTKPQFLTFIYIDDLLEIIFRSMETEVSRKAYFVSDGNLYPSEKLNDIIKSLLDKKALKLKLPLPVVKVIANLSEQVSKVTGKYPALNRDKFEELKCRNWNCDISNLVEDLDYTPEHSLEDGMRKTVEWYKKEAWL